MYVDSYVIFFYTRVRFPPSPQILLPTFMVGFVVFAGVIRGNRKPEHDGARRGREIFQQKNTCDRKRTRVSRHLCMRESKSFSLFTVK